jgi:Fe-S-cluster containining protein
METGKASFTLRLGNNQYKCELNLTNAPVRVSDMLPVLNSLTDLVVQSATGEEVEQGRQISCRAGCGACCRQPVPVSPHEMELLRSVVEGMESGRRERVRQRFADAVERMRQGGILEAVKGIGALSEEERLEAGHRYFALGIACPFLEDESCSIYEQRPMRCREYLVTSPPDHCANPAPETVKMVELKAAPSLSLYSIGEGEGGAKPEFVVMTVLTEWAGPPSTAATVAAPRILKSFLSGLGGAEPKPEAKPE